MLLRSFLRFRNLERPSVTAAKIWDLPHPDFNPLGEPTGAKRVRRPRRGLTLLNYYVPVISDMGPPVISVRDRRGEIKSSKRIPLRIDHMGTSVWKTEKDLYRAEKIEYYKTTKNRYPTKKFAGARQKKKKKAKK